jgi:hypothetical protein
MTTARQCSVVLLEYCQHYAQRVLTESEDSFSNEKDGRWRGPEKTVAAEILKHRT